MMSRLEDSSEKGRMLRSEWIIDDAGSGGGNFCYSYLCKSASMLFLTHGLSLAAFDFNLPISEEIH